MAASLDSFFNPSGPLAQSTQAFEVRVEQREMARSVDQALQEGRHLIVEAGTGVGKSFAYLLPAALWAVQQKKKVAVATYTKALQEQLVRNDLPVVQDALKRAGLTFKYALLMGAENYLCQQRLARCVQHEPEFLDSPPEHEMLGRLQAWAGTAGTGLRSKIPFPVPSSIWERVRRDTDLCLGRQGPFWESCLFRKDAEGAARAADVLILNQHLLFAGGRLPKFDAVVIDEAHTLEKVGARFSAVSLNNRKVKRLLDDLYNPQSKKGIMRRLNVSAAWAERLRQAVAAATGKADRFFESLRRQLNGAPALRVQEPGIVEDALSPVLNTLADLLEDALGLSRNSEEEAETRSLKTRVLQTAHELETFLKCEDKNCAYWMESSGARSPAGAAKTPVTSLNVAPLDVAETLRAELFKTYSTVILTSATLAVGRSFDAIKARIGMGESLEKWVDSPFDYHRQAALYIDPSIPDPKADPAAYEEALLRRSLEILQRTPGGAFVLFTNWQLLEKAHRAWSVAATGRPLFKQGEASTHELLEQFKRLGNGILLGTETFWQGVDVPGTALSCVILTRLPFVSPESPLEQARQEWMESRGMDVFAEYALPTAITRFRQGFGRLIRSAKDIGAVAILDPRISTKPYGRAFLRSIPPCRSVQSLEALSEFFEEWLAVPQASK